MKRWRPYYLRLMVTLAAAGMLMIMANTTAAGPVRWYFPDEPPLTPHCLYMPGSHEAYAVEWYRGVVKVSPPWWEHPYTCPVRP